MFLGVAARFLVLFSSLVFTLNLFDDLFVLNYLSLESILITLPTLQLANMLLLHNEFDLALDRNHKIHISSCSSVGALRYGFEMGVVLQEGESAAALHLFWEYPGRQFIDFGEFDSFLILLVDLLRARRCL
jgi:hypothetical protein